MPHAADGDAETKETVGHDRGTVHRNQSDYSGKLRPAGPPADGIADQSQQGPLFPIGPHLAAFRSPPEQHANPERPQVYLLSFVSHEAQGPTKKLYELADRRRQAYAQCHSYGMIRENLDTISAFFFKFLLHEQETCRINLGPYFKNGKSFIRLKVGVTNPFHPGSVACLEVLRGVPFLLLYLGRSTRAVLRLTQTGVTLLLPGICALEAYYFPENSRG